MLLAVIRGRAVVEVEVEIEVDVLKLSSNSRNAHDISGRILIGIEIGALRRLKEIPNRCIYRGVETNLLFPLCTTHSNELVQSHGLAILS